MTTVEPTPTADTAATHEFKRIRRYVFFTFLMTLLTAVYFTRDLLLSIVIAVILTLTLLPAIRFGEPYRVPTRVVSVIVAVALVFGGLGYVLSGPARTLAADVPRITEEVQNKFGGILDRVAALRESANEVMGDAATPTMIDTNGDSVATMAVVVEIADDESGLADQIVAGLPSTSGAVDDQAATGPSWRHQNMAIGASARTWRRNRP